MGNAKQVAAARDQVYLNYYGPVTCNLSLFIPVPSTWFLCRAHFKAGKLSSTLTCANRKATE